MTLISVLANSLISLTADCTCARISHRDDYSLNEAVHAHITFNAFAHTNVIISSNKQPIISQSNLYSNLVSFQLSSIHLLTLDDFPVHFWLSSLVLPSGKLGPWNLYSPYINLHQFVFCASTSIGMWIKNSAILKLSPLPSNPSMSFSLSPSLIQQPPETPAFQSHSLLIISKTNGSTNGDYTFNYQGPRADTSG